MTTCDHTERALLAEVNRGGGDTVTIHRCRDCDEVIERAFGTVPHWVQARAIRFESMRDEARALAGITIVI